MIEAVGNHIEHAVCTTERATKEPNDGVDKDHTSDNAAEVATFMVESGEGRRGFGDEMRRRRVATEATIDMDGFVMHCVVVVG